MKIYIKYFYSYVKSYKYNQIPGKYKNDNNFKDMENKNLLLISIQSKQTKYYKQKLRILYVTKKIQTLKI